MQNKFDNYEFRCSSLGKIISKSGKMTQGVETYLQELVIEAIHNVRKEISSKYFEKGIYCEEDGINLLNETLYKGRLLVKNKERKHNGWIQGETDNVAPDDIIHDIKNAYDRFTFGKADLTHEYKLQLKGYCWLWGKSKARLFYCLNNMPEHLLMDEEKKLFYKGNYITYENEDYQAKCEELRAFHNYDNMELWERFKFWDIGFTDADIDIIKTGVQSARKYMNELYDEYLNNIRKNMAAMGLNSDVIILPHDQKLQATIIAPFIDLEEDAMPQPKLIKIPKEVKEELKQVEVKQSIPILTKIKS